MGANSKIQWCDHTFNPWVGCQKVSPGCVNCYAAENTFVRIQRNEGRELWGNEARSERHVTSGANWHKPLAWDRAAEAKGERARVFCASLADVFEHRDELWEPRDRLWALIAETPWLDWQLLTKRPENVLDMVPGSWLDAFPPNVWLGTSVENQAMANERIPHLLRTPARVRFLSCEPLVGPVHLGRVPAWDSFVMYGAGLHWVIIGGESGPNARPMDVAWARSLVQQCQRAGMPAFMKQLGRYPCNTTGAYYDLNDPKGGNMAEWPEDLRVREMPETTEE